MLLLLWKAVLSISPTPDPEKVNTAWTKPALWNDHAISMYATEYGVLRTGISNTVRPDTYFILDGRNSSPIGETEGFLVLKKLVD